MPRENKDEDKKISRSVRLKKYGIVYKSFLRKVEEMKKSPRKNRKNIQIKTNKSRKKTLNSYQKFVRVESNKEKYKNLPSNIRLKQIALEWKKIKK